MLDIENEIYRERHFAELERRGQINDRADAQVSLLTIFVAIIGYYLLGFPKLQLSISFVLFSLCFVVLIAGTLGAGIYVGLLVWSDVATYLPNPSTDRKYAEDTLQYQLSIDAVNGRSAAEAQISQRFYENFRVAADENAKRNDKRDSYILRSKIWIVAAVAGFILTAGFHLYLTNGSDKISHEASDSLNRDDQMAEQNSTPKPQSTSGPAPATQASATSNPTPLLTKPEPPPLKHISAFKTPEAATNGR